MGQKHVYRVVLSTARSQKVDVEVRGHLDSTPDRPLWKAIVTTRRGRCYFAIYAGDEPSAEKVAADYLADRGTTKARNWGPYCA